MTNEHDTTTKITPVTFTALKQELSATLHDHNLEDADRLARQMGILDQIFDKITHRKINLRMDEDMYMCDAAQIQSWLNFALRIQKQCIDTVKARAAMEYMQNICGPKLEQYPSASITQKEKHGGKNEEGRQKREEV